MRKTLWLLPTLLGVLLLAGSPAHSQDPNAPVDTSEADANSADPNDQDASPVLVTVGKKEITKAEVDEMVERLPQSFPAYQVATFREQTVDYWVMTKLRQRFLTAKKVSISDEEVDAYRKGFSQAVSALSQGQYDPELVLALQSETDETIRTNLMMAKYAEKAIDANAVESFVKDNPNCFDGTTVTVRHILLKCDYTDPSETQKLALGKIAKIAVALREGKATFEQAATLHSDCGSSAEGGKLGEISYGGQMDLLFTKAALETEKGKISDIVRTQFGYHLILVEDRSEGEVKVEMTPRNRMLAREGIRSQLERKIASQALDSCPIKTP